ncbi:MAG: cytochrome c-type biogenesis protein [Pseudomonadales bacterium]
MLTRITLAIWLSFGASICVAAIDAHSFPDEEMRDRYRELINELRCPQCLNTNIAGSDAMIAKDLRRETHRLLLEGKSNEEILEYMHQRYGDFILYEPPLRLGTAILWFGPPALLIIALIIFLRIVWKRKSVESVLTDADQERLDKLVGKKDV